MVKGPTIDRWPVSDGWEESPAVARRAEASGSGESSGLALDLRAAADTLILTRTASATDATLAVRLAGPRLESVDLRGRIGKGDTMLRVQPVDGRRSEEHTSELQSLMRISYAVFCLKNKNQHTQHISNNLLQ